MPQASMLHGDKGYDSNAIRRRVEDKGAMPNIPPKVNRRWKNCFSPFLYRNRNAIERMFGRLKDFRRIATGYDRLAANFLAAVWIRWHPTRRWPRLTFADNKLIDEIEERAHLSIKPRNSEY
jgi:transposase